tara:strand:- start:100 stop:321 length:222 start_codon:yes stop_codon:yes gene_type:complete
MIWSVLSESKKAQPQHSSARLPVKANAKASYAMSVKLRKTAVIKQAKPDMPKKNVSAFDIVLSIFIFIAPFTC